MELIVASFLLIGVSLFGQMAMVIADQLRRPRRRIFRLGEESQEPPPKRAPIPFRAAGVELART